MKLPLYTFYQHFYRWDFGVGFELDPHEWDVKKQDYLKFTPHFRIMLGPYTLDWMV